MKRNKKFISKSRLSTFIVPKETTNEEMLEMVYKDFAEKVRYIQQVYPYSGGNLHSYDRIKNHFEFEYDYYLDDEVEYFSDTFEESQNAFDNGIFPCERDYFGKGEFPIFLIERRHNDRRDSEDIVSYTITR